MQSSQRDIQVTISSAHSSQQGLNKTELAIKDASQLAQKIKDSMLIQCDTEKKSKQSADTIRRLNDEALQHEPIYAITAEDLKKLSHSIGQTLNTLAIDNAQSSTQRRKNARQSDFKAIQSDTGSSTLFLEADSRLGPKLT